MKLIKKLAGSLLIILIILIATSSVWLKAVPPQYFSLLTGKSVVLDRAVCRFSTKVGGESMNPLIAPGSTVEVSRCFADGDLTEGVVVLFHDGANLRFGIIRHLLPLDPVVYKVSDEKAPELLHDVIREEITGIAEGVDVSSSKYQAKKEAESFILDAAEYVSEVYLARIPRGMGIESSTVEKTTSFSRQEDKFCSVVTPLRELRHLDIEIINTQPQQVVRSSTDLVFSVRPEPNINCDDFGSGPGQLDLEPGSYRYRFLLSHQVLADIPFTVH